MASACYLHLPRVLTRAGSPTSIRSPPPSSLPLPPSHDLFLLSIEFFYVCAVTFLDLAASSGVVVPAVCFLKGASASLSSRRNYSLIAMASGGQQFPPQKQEAQPGKEHVMDPNPQPVSKDYKPANKLLGKVALVTGGDSGIGRSVCLHYALEGASVAFTYVKSQEDKDASDTLRMLKELSKSRDKNAKDPMAMAIPADLGFEENCRKVVDEVVNAFGPIDILVNNAAEQYVATCITEIGEEQLERVFRTNIFSYFLTAKYAIKHMKEGSCIINTTSINAYKGNAQLLDYTATKGAIVAFTRGLALQVVGRGIRVNGVAPGPVWTPLIPASFPEDKVAQFGKEVPMGRAAQPNEIAPCYVFLASPADSSYIAGQVLHPNGGVVVNG